MLKPSTLVVAAVWLASSLAHADTRVAALEPPGETPELGATAAAPAALPSLYLSAGASFGADDAADWVSA